MYNITMHSFLSKLCSIPQGYAHADCLLLYKYIDMDKILGGYMDCCTVILRLIASRAMLRVRC